MNDTTKNTTKKQLVIIAGAAGEIGTEYLKTLSGNGIDCIAVIRNRQITIESEYISVINCDLTDSASISRAFADVKLRNYETIIYLHTIGIDKFDPRGYPAVQKMETIPAEVYDTNVNTFKYLLKYLVGAIQTARCTYKATNLKVAMIGGVSDKYAPFVIESFCEAKFIIRQYIQSAISIHPAWISGISINITSTITNSALHVRPYANTEYWLTTAEVVDRSMVDLLSDKDNYYEIDIIKYSPEYISGYYENNEQLYAKWSRETGISSENRFDVL